MAKQDLISLTEFNKNRRLAHRAQEDLHVNVPNGIACPKCGEELVDDDRRVRCMSDPPQYHVHCPACGHKTYRVC
jgi:hypothetical protein